MLTIEKPLSLPDTYPLGRLGQLEKLLFFDIETTGFSGSHSRLYLIGCTYWRDESWHLIQWFADTADSEPELLHAFFRFLGQFQVLIHFNGDGFDLPFIQKRCSRYNIPCGLDRLESIDIYRKIRPYRKLLGLDSLRQKAIEQFLGISRQDLYSGGQLVEVYKEYLITRRTDLYDLLILHNEDDLKGMPLILPVLNYPDFLEHPFCLSGQRIVEKTDPSGRACHLLELSLDSSYSVPVPFYLDAAPVSCSVKDSRMTLTIEIYEGTLKHFYPNYQDYYYLIFEDTAVHKSIGEYVDKNARTKATAKTCYTRQEGRFLPQFSPIWEPVMKRDPKDKLSYAPLDRVCLQDPECLQSYIRQLLAHLGVRSDAPDTAPDPQKIKSR